jgi:hypothetical protein
LKHVRAGQDVFRKEIQASGFRVVSTRKVPPLKETFFLRFEKAMTARRGQNLRPLIPLSFRGSQGRRGGRCGLLDAELVPDLDESLRLGVAPGEPIVL